IVFASNALTYLSATQRAALVSALAAAGAERDLVVIVNEAAGCGVRLFSTEAPAGPPAQAVATLAMVSWQDGRPSTVDALALTGPHGAWLSWQPASYPYAVRHGAC